GPHGAGGIRIFYEPLLLDSLRAHKAEHPAGAAAVVELYAADHATRIGWAVSVKVAAQSDGGFGWFWMEALDHGPNVPPQFVDGEQGTGGAGGSAGATSGMMSTTATAMASTGDVSPAGGTESTGQQMTTTVTGPTCNETGSVHCNHCVTVFDCGPPIPNTSL